MASRLTQDLEVKLVASKSSPEKTTDKQTDSIAVLGAEASLPSYVVDLDNVRAIRVKLHGLKAMWSQEIAVTGEKRKDSRLVKVGCMISHIILSIRHWRASAADISVHCIHAFSECVHVGV